MWRELRNRRFARFKFRRQHVIVPYIVDFCCLARKVIVELDGESHLGKAAQDQDRQAILESLGFVVVRCWNTTVYEDLDSLLEAIWNACTRPR